MEAFITYLLKVHLLIAILYLAYWLLLRNEKLFHLNRIFLLATLVIAVSLPLMPPVLKPDANVLQYPISAFNSINSFYETPSHDMATGDSNDTLRALPLETGLHFSLTEILLLAYSVVGLALFIRFGLRLLSLYSFILNRRKGVCHGLRHCDHDENVAPFSFFSFLVINRSHFTDAQLMQICTHEKVHIRQWHTIDLLISEVIHILLWINPVMPLLKRSVKLNLEYLADEAVLNSGCDKRMYQLNILYGCLKQRTFPLTNLFSSSKIKSRIKMMNAKKSPVTHLYKYALVVTLVLASYLVIQPLGVQAVEAKGNDSGTANPNLSIFEGYYSYHSDDRFIVGITSDGQGLTLKEFWTGKKYFFPASVGLEFLNKEKGFPLKFVRSKEGGIVQLIAFNRDVWDRLDSYKPDISQEFTLTQKELKAFEGFYQFQKNPEAYLHFTVKDKGLIAKQVWDGKEFFIVPKSALEFYSQQEHYPAKFIKAHDGVISQVHVMDKDVWVKVSRYTPRKFITLSPEKLKAFEGKYTFQFQPGKDAFIVVTSKGNQLVLKETWNGNEIVFDAYSEHEFYNRERAFTLQFMKDRNGTVTQVLAFSRDLWTKVK